MNRQALIRITLILLLASALRLYHLSAVGDGVLFYTASVHGLLNSPTHFFFAVADPSGLAMVDKPPIGLWVMGLAGLLWGTSGFSIALSGIFAGILALAVFYRIVCRLGGDSWAWWAVLIVAIAPMSVAVDRSNPIDSVLILWLMLAILAFQNANLSGRLMSLLISAVCIGFGFHTKLLMAFFPLPAMLFDYHTSNPSKRRFVYSLLWLVVIVFVSSLWIITIDLIPPDQRPRVIGSSDNSMLDLTLNYNGSARLFGAEDESVPTTSIIQPLTLYYVGWLLPFAVGGMWLLRRKTVFWSMWLLTGIVYVSAVQIFQPLFHAYYLAMFIFPIAVLAAGSLRQLSDAATVQMRWCIGLLALITLLFQVWIASGPVDWRLSALGLIVVLWVIGTWRSSGTILGFSMLLLPSYWLLLSLMIAPANVLVMSHDPLPPVSAGNRINPALLTFLTTNTAPDSILMAVPSPAIGAPYIIVTDRGVLYLGGFAEKSILFSMDDIAELTQSRQLRYILDMYGILGRQQPELLSWMEAYCRAIPLTEIDPAYQQTRQGSQDRLFDCSP